MVRVVDGVVGFFNAQCLGSIQFNRHPVTVRTGITLWSECLSTSRDYVDNVMLPTL